MLFFFFSVLWPHSLACATTPPLAVLSHSNWSACSQASRLAVCARVQLTARRTRMPSNTRSSARHIPRWRGRTGTRSDGRRRGATRRTRTTTTMMTDSKLSKPWRTTLLLAACMTSARLACARIAIGHTVRIFLTVALPKSPLTVGPPQCTYGPRPTKVLNLRIHSERGNFF